MGFVNESENAFTTFISFTKAAKLLKLRRSLVNVAERNCSPTFTSVHEGRRTGLAGRALAIVAAGLCGFLLNGFTASAQAAEPADGLYLRTNFAFGSLNIDTLYFKDGQVAKDPAGPLEKFDFDQARKASPSTVGKAQRKGNQMSVAWGDGKATEGSFEAKDRGCFFWSGLACPVKAFSKGEKLDGVFSGGASAGGGAVSSSRTLTLGKDGKYTLSGGGVVAPGGNVSGAAGSFSKEEGSYELSGNTLTLKPSGGPARTLLTFPYDDGTKGEQPRRMYLDGLMLKRS